MGYHANEEATKQCIKDAQRFINDRARLEYGLRIALQKLGVRDEEQNKIVQDVRSNNFDSLSQVDAKHRLDGAPEDMSVVIQLKITGNNAEIRQHAGS
jgi:hypothetical protein